MFFRCQSTRSSLMLVAIMLVPVFAAATLATDGASAAPKTAKRKKATPSTQAATPTTTGSVVTTAPAATVAPTAPPAANREPYKVSVMTDLTGGLAGQGTAALAGFTAVVKMVNDAGGVNGHPIQLATAIDSLSTVDGAQAAAAKVVGEKPTAILEYGSTTGIAAIAPIFSAAKIPVMSSQVVDSLILPTPEKWFFTTGAAQAQLVSMYVNEARALLGPLQGKRIGLEGVATAGVDNTINGMKTAFPKEGVSVVSTERTPLTGVSSFASQAANMTAANPDLVIVQDTIASSTLVVKALRTAGFNGPILSSAGANDDATLANINDAGFYVPRNYYNPLTGDLMGRTAAKYGLSDKIVSGLFPISWAAAMALVAGLKKCGFPCSADALPVALESLTTFDPGERVAFGPVGFTPKKHYAPSIVQFYTWSPTAFRTAPAGPPVEMVAG